MKLGWNNEYSEYIHALYPNPKLKTRSITFQITDSCNLKCSYCLTGDTTILMSDFNSTIGKRDYSDNKNLYKFLATSYDISNLAGKIRASKKSDSL